MQGLSTGVEEEGCQVLFHNEYFFQATTFESRYSVTNRGGVHVNTVWHGSFHAIRYFKARDEASVIRS